MNFLESHRKGECLEYIGTSKKSNRERWEQGFDKHESLWKGRDGVWGREGEAFLQKGSSSPPQSSLPNSPYPRTARYSASLRPSWLQTKRSSSESGDAAGADSTGRLPVLWNDESAAMGETAPHPSASQDFHKGRRRYGRLGKPFLSRPSPGLEM